MNSCILCSLVIGSKSAIHRGLLRNSSTSSEFASCTEEEWHEYCLQSPFKSSDISGILETAENLSGKAHHSYALSSF